MWATVTAPDSLVNETSRNVEDAGDARRSTHNPATLEPGSRQVHRLRLGRTRGASGARRTAPSSSLLDCLGRVRRVKAKPHAVASRALTRRPRSEGGQLSRRTGEDQDAATGAGRAAVSPGH